MSETFFIVCFIILTAMAIVWFPLIVWVFHRLRIRHAAIYEELGSPSLFWNNSIRNQWLFLKFCFGSQWNRIGDEQLAKAVRFIRVWLILYMAGFSLFVTVLLALGIR